MNNAKYVVKRNKVCIGRVVCTDAIHQEEGTGKLYTGSFHTVRSILFVPNKRGYADDLLYYSMTYPILNFTDNSKVLYKVSRSKGKPIFVIDDAYNLGQLLEFYGYDEKLTMFDILNIKNSLFAQKFMKGHCQDFGYEITKQGYSCIDPDNEFSKAFTVIINRSDRYTNPTKDAFTPKKEEGRVRKISRPKVNTN